MNVIRPLHLHSRALEARTDPFRARGALSDSDVLIVDAVAPRFRETSEDVLLALALAARAPRVGHVGVDLSDVGNVVGRELVGRFDPTAADELPLPWPDDAARWEQAVLRSEMVGGPDAWMRPFVAQAALDRTLLMTRRMWVEQERLAAAIRFIAASPPAPRMAPEMVERAIEVLFEDPDDQGARAVRAAARGRLTVVTGGPGTGKTTCIKRLLALLLASPRPDGRGALRVELAAPTGKAAVRMAEAMAEGLDELPTTEPVRQALRELQPRTLHKLLGARPDGSCRHGSDRPLVADVVVVDEVSMIDLVRMRQLCEAVGPETRLVLLGDRDQLVSVEAGTVLADLVSVPLARPCEGALADSIIAFDRSYRFRDAPSIGRVAAELQSGTPAGRSRALELLCGAECAEDPVRDRITFLGSSEEGRPTDTQLAALVGPYLDRDGYAGVIGAAIAAHGEGSPALRDPERHLIWLARLADYRVLAVHRRGPLGVSGLGRALEEAVRSALSEAAGGSLPARGAHWLGRPVLVTENAYDVGLMNGDIGVVLPVEGAGPRGLAAVFPVTRHGRRSVRSVPLSRLPPHSGALVMTVHKSQGSQFGRVALVLAGRPSPIQTRELVYTGITRARRRLDWLGSVQELGAALDRPISRASGLSELVWGEAAQSRE